MLPQSVEEALKKLEERSGASHEELVAHYWSVYFRPFMQLDPQFASVSSRHDYATSLLWNEVIQGTYSKHLDNEIVDILNAIEEKVARLKYIMKVKRESGGK